MRRRIGTGVVVILVVIAAAHFALKRPVEVDLDVGFANAPKLREVDLVFTRGDEHVERELKWLYSEGAPARDHKSVRLMQGRYTVGARFIVEGTPPLTASRPLIVGEPGRYSIDF